MGRIKAISRRSSNRRRRSVIYIICEGNRRLNLFTVHSHLYQVIQDVVSEMGVQAIGGSHLFLWHAIGATQKQRFTIFLSHKENNKTLLHLVIYDSYCHTVIIRLLVLHSITTLIYNLFFKFQVLVLEHDV